MSSTDSSMLVVAAACESVKESRDEDGSGSSGVTGDAPA